MGTAELSGNRDNGDDHGGHRVHVSPFYLQQQEVTSAEYRRFGSKPQPRRAGRPSGDERQLVRRDGLRRVARWKPSHRGTMGACGTWSGGTILPLGG